MTTPNNIDTSRQNRIIPDKRLAESRVAIIGCGAVGYQLTQQLAAMGVPYIELFDDDTIDASNLTSSGFPPHLIHANKVSAAAQAIDTRECVIVKTPERFTPDAVTTADVLFTCVDSMEARQIANDFARNWAFGKLAIIDPRVAGETVECYGAWTPKSLSLHRKTICPQDDAYPEPCGAKMTIYSAAIAAGLACSMFARWLQSPTAEPPAPVSGLTLELGPTAWPDHTTTPTTIVEGAV